MHLRPIDRGQTRLARPYPGGLFEKAVAAQIRTLDPETAANYLNALGTHGQPGINGLYVKHHPAGHTLEHSRDSAICKSRKRATSLKAPFDTAGLSLQRLISDSEPTDTPPDDLE